MSLSPAPSSPPSAIVQTPRLPSRSPTTYTSSRSRRQTKKPAAYGSVINSDNIEDYLDPDQQTEDEDQVEEDEESDDYEKGGGADEDEGEEGDDAVDDDEESEEEVLKKSKKGGSKAAPKAAATKTDKVKKSKETTKAKDKKNTTTKQTVKTSTTKTTSKALAKPSLPPSKPKAVVLKAAKAKATKTVISRSTDHSDEEEADEEKEKNGSDDVEKEAEGAAPEASANSDDNELDEDSSSQRPFSWNGKASKPLLSTPVKPQSSIPLSSPPTAPMKPLGVGAKTGVLGVKPKPTAYGSTKDKAGVSSKSPGAFKNPSALATKPKGKVELKKVELQKVDKAQSKVKEVKKVELKKNVRKEKTKEVEGGDGADMTEQGPDNEVDPDIGSAEEEDVAVEQVEEKKPAPNHESKTKAKTKSGTSQTKLTHEKLPSTSSIASSNKTNSSSSSKRRLVPEVVIPTRKRSLTGDSQESGSDQALDGKKKKTTKSTTRSKAKNATKIDEDGVSSTESGADASPNAKSKSKKAGKPASDSQPESQESDYDASLWKEIDDPFQESQMPMTQVAQSKKVKEEASEEDHSMNESQDSQGSKKSTSSKKRKHTEEPSQSSDGSPSKKRPAPAEKVTSEHRALIMVALTDAKFTSTLKFDPVGIPSSKCVRHWREVLSKDLTKLFKGESSKGTAKGAITPSQRLGIWKVVCESIDKADWASVAEQTGMTVGKLKRHFRESMRKEGEKFIGK